MLARRIIRPAWFAGLFFGLVGCMMPASSQPATTTPSPTETNISSDWQTLMPGLEQRIYHPQSGFLTQLTALRINPDYFTFRTHYRPGEPAFASIWRSELPDAAIIVNTNFFDREDRILGMLIADGITHGTSYRRRGGTFFIQNGIPNIKSLLTETYNGEMYEQAIQAFPMLITNGQQSYFDTRADRPTRRTIIGIDSQGHVIILITSFGGITLLDLAEYLPTTDLNLQQALNLDGGGSTLLDIKAGEDKSSFVSFDPVPAVLGVYPHE